MRQIRGGDCIRVRGLGIAVVVLLASVVLSGCLLDTETFVCEASGRRCTRGQICTSEGLCVYKDSCGDNNLALDKGEICDDGNLIDGDGCDSNCTPTGCGNGIPTDEEKCDDGNLVDGDGCDSNCKPTGCRNGITVDPEMCDDGNDSNLDSCLDDCTLNVCGDGYRDPAKEECDDGNRLTELCSGYNATCTVCGPDCALVPGVQQFCGDGVVQAGFENCDDGNMLACGTCNVMCTASELARETGFIVTVSAVNIRSTAVDYLALHDGQLTVDFKYTFSDPPPPGSTTEVWIVLQGSPAADNSHEVAEKTITAINNYQNLRITAALFGDPMNTNFIMVTHDQIGDMNDNDVRIDNHVMDVGFSVAGMTGGAGSLCSAGNGCKSNADCATNVCVINVLTPDLPGMCQ